MPSYTIYAPFICVHIYRHNVCSTEGCNRCDERIYPLIERYHYKAKHKMSMRDHCIIIHHGGWRDAGLYLTNAYPRAYMHSLCACDRYGQQHAGAAQILIPEPLFYPNVNRPSPYPLPSSPWGARSAGWDIPELIDQLTNQSR